MGTLRQLRFTVLGPVRAWLGDVPLDLGPVRQQALLVALMLRPDATVSRQELLDGIWGAEPPGTGGKVIPVYVHRLRERLRAAGAQDTVISRDRGGYRFVSEGARVDTARLEEIAVEAASARASGDLRAAVDTWSHALKLFHGEPLSGLPGPFAEGERLRLTERRIALLQEKLECQLRLGRYAEAVSELSALTATHPHSESLAALLMRAMYGSGRQADALSVFTQVRGRLVDDLAVEPGEELRRVHQAVLRGDDAFLLGDAPRRAPAEAPLATAPAAPSAPGHRRRNELPGDVGELTGRAREIALLTAPYRTDAVSVLAVDGVAGVGKTALVVRAARLLQEGYPDGCLFVDLHGHSADREPPAPMRVLRRLLRAVGADDESDDLDELAASWRAATASTRSLLVLDDAVGAEQIRPLLPAGAGSRVLVTSRRRLAGLDVDQRVSLGPLDLDEAGELLARFVGDARAYQEPEAVRQLARLCDRLPLALRIAGARLQSRPMWTFEYLVARLSDDERRLGELTAEDRSVEAAFRLSYDHLPPCTQRAFRALGLSPTVEFDGLTLAAMLGWSRHETEHALESLVDASLLWQPTAGRYRLHDLVAAYARRLAAEHPAEVTAARTGVFRLYVTAARCANGYHREDPPAGPAPDFLPFADAKDAASWLDAAAGEIADVAAHAAAVGHVDEACLIADSLIDYLVREGRYHECRAVAETVLPLVEASESRLASSLRTCLGIAYGLQGDYEQAYAWLNDALAISGRSGDLREQARALGVLGTVARWAGRTSEALARLTKVLELAGPLGDDWLVGMATCNLGAAYQQLGRYDEALEHYARSLRLAEKIGSPRVIGKTLSHIGSLHMDRGRLAEAIGPLHRAADLAGEIGDLPQQAAILTRLGMTEEGLGNTGAALELHRRALAAVREQTNVGLEVEIRNRLGGSLLATGDLDEAREQFEAVLALSETAGSPEQLAGAIEVPGRWA
ncbi:AfsR/SARP family transcriptional regulator [Actinoallomurus iriomotensis]|uniref:Regulatory protein AfsR n=1 Tax=Actinoallomurus iriomotensis TaxID=478107 RepID=A0A9W6RTC1_9ACTN|nr:BTAD domain-containing putative transcriptional regulator [Actinoallomurus iriomotensis]GLY81343.1 regulatory protein AfsR [Actinoallomurus iriomotensis]